MRIAYVLPRPELGGGNKVIFLHAHLLAHLGHTVTLLGEGPAPDWFRLRVPYRDQSLGVADLPAQDLLIATYWTTLARARELHRAGLGPMAHFCQGYEGYLDHLAPRLAEIEVAYARPLPALVVSPHLEPMLRGRFGRRTRVAPPVLDPAFRRRPWVGRRRPRRRPWIAVPGIFEAPVKGVRTALAAVARLRERGIEARVLRVSALPLCEDERRLLAPDIYLCHVRPADVARSLRRADLLFLASRDGEGFGLPALEAMALGVPVVASDIEPVRAFGEDAVELVSPEDPEAFAEAARRLLIEPRRWRRARRAGLEVARRFRPERIAPILDDAVRWARDEARRAVAAGPNPG